MVFVRKYILSPNIGQGTVTPTAKGNITLLGDTFSGYSTFRNSEFKKALTELGITLTYEDEFDQAKRAQLLNEGKAELFVTTLDQFLKHKPQGKIVGLVDRTVGADAIVLNTKKYPNLKSLLDLKQLVETQNNQGKPLTITYAVDTPSEYLALVLSTQFETFNLADFEVKEVADSSEAWELLQDQSQEVAVAVLWEPFVTQARKQGYTVVLSSEDTPTSIVDIIVASDKLINSQPDLISNFLEAYYRRIDSNVREPSQLKKQIAEDGNLSQNEADSILKGIDFFTSIEAKTWMSDDTLKNRINSIAAILVLSGKLNQVPANPEQLYDVNYINKAAANTESLISLIRTDNPQLADRLAGKGDTIGTVSTVSQTQISQAPDIGNLEVRGEVTFNTASATLTPQSQQTITKLAQEIKEFNPQTVAIRVIGHTSKTGSPDFNQKLSQDRADAVKNALKNLGLQHNIVAEGKGFYLPSSAFPPEDPRQQRTEIRLVRINN